MQDLHKTKAIKVPGKMLWMICQPYHILMSYQQWEVPEEAESFFPVVVATVEFSMLP